MDWRRRVLPIAIHPQHDFAAEGFRLVRSNRVCQWGLRATPWNAASMRDRGFAVWNVATIGPSATISAIIDRLGATGSCTCRTSNLPALIHFRTLV